MGRFISTGLRTSFAVEEDLKIATIEVLVGSGTFFVV
jgi:hypothetical protein